jgi:broad specificity phosphatase PhoE
MPEKNWLSEPSTASKRLIFARHGEYPCNVRGVCNSNPRTGFYLTEKGEAQGRALGERLKDEKIELIVTSEFLRARQTAWLANEVLKVPQVVNRLANENRVGAAFEEKSSDEFQRFIAHAPATTATADGEPFMGLLARVQSLIADLKLSSPETVLVVTHGWPLQAVRVILNEIDVDDAARCVGMPSNCEIVEGWF